MKITNTKPIGPVDRVTSSDPPVSTPAKDRVSVSESRSAHAAAESTRSAVSSNRAGRLKDIEAQVRAGAFRPNPSRVADEILQDAEIDARLRQMLNH